MARPAIPAIQRFMSKVKAVEGGCHEWQAKRHNRQGYGCFTDRTGNTVYAHRFIWSHLNGPIPQGMVICHRCDNPSCVNPEHLFLGTNSDNVRDMVAKGRAWGRRKVTNEDAKKIRDLLASGMSQEKVGAAIGLCQTTISRVKLGQTQYMKRI